MNLVLNLWHSIRKLTINLKRVENYNTLRKVIELNYLSVNLLGNYDIFKKVWGPVSVFKTGPIRVLIVEKCIVRQGSESECVVDRIILIF